MQQADMVAHGHYSVRYYKTEENRWHWVIYSGSTLTYPLARCRVDGYSSKQAAKNSFVGVRNALAALPQSRL